MFLSSKDLSLFGSFINDSARVVTRLFLELRELEHLTRFEKDTKGNTLHHIRDKVATLWPYLDSVLRTRESKKYVLWLLDGIDRGIGLETLDPKIQSIPFEIHDLLMNQVSHFRKATRKEAIFNAVFPTLEEFFTYYHDAKDFISTKIEKCVISSDSSRLDILLKDLLVNACKSTNTMNPKVRITGKVLGNSYRIIIENNQWPSRSTLDQMVKNNFPETNKGWASVVRFAKDLRIKIDIPKPSQVPNEHELLINPFFQVCLTILIAK